MPADALFIVCTWPSSATDEPFGRNLAFCATMRWMSEATAPRSRSWVVAKISTSGWMLYWLTTALLIVRGPVASPPSTCDVPCRAAVIGRFCREASESRLYWGVCITIGYDTPLALFSQKVGATWLEPARFTT